MLNWLEGCILPFRVGVALNPFERFFFEHPRLEKWEVVVGHG